MEEKDQPEQRDPLLKREDKAVQDNQEDPNNKSWIVKIYEDNKNISFGLSFLGRLIMTFYSLHGLFFCYNLILEYFLLIPGFLFTIENGFAKIFLSIIYISYSLCLSNILVIPTFEFFTFPYLKYPYSLSHLISFIYIYKEKEFDNKKIIYQNPRKTFFLNIFFYVIEIVYITGYLLSIFTKVIIIKDLIKCFILILVYLNYLAIFMNYVFISMYLIIKILFSKVTDKVVIDTKEKGVLMQVQPPQHIGNNNNNKIEFEKEIGNNNYKLTIEQKDGEIQDKYKVLIETYKKINLTSLNSWKGLNLAILYKINNYFKDKPKLPDINLVSYIIEPYLFRNYVDKNGNELKELKEYHYEDVCFNLGIIIKILYFFVILILTLFLGFYKMNIESLFYLFLLSLCILAVSLAFNFPSCYRNRKTFGTNICDPKYQLYTDKKRGENRKLKYKPRNPNLLSIARFICDSILLLVSLGLVVIFFVFKDDEKKIVFNNIKPSEEAQNTKNLLLPNICFSSIHNMGLHLFLPFINDAYYYNTNSSFDSENYKRLFYNDDYDITVLGNLINEAESVKMIGYNVINREKDIEVTILSIKGTSFNKDMYLDAQLFISSILMTLLNTFSLITQKNLWSFKIMEYSLSIPYRIFFKHLIVDEYIKKLENAYNATEYKFFDNVVIVGHSLGGGLAKLFGRMVKKQAISLSGPGINAFHSLWNYKGESENFEISAIDLVPDRDLVPRVEVSGGTTYRIICKFGAFGCHSKVNSLCEVLIMCNSPNYNEYCDKVAGLSKEEIKEIVDSIQLNN